jgi:hypothetical protein
VYCFEAKALSDLNGLENLIKQKSGEPGPPLTQSTLLMNEHKNNIAEYEKPSTSYMLPPIDAHSRGDNINNLLYQTLSQTADSTDHLHSV